MTYLLTRASNNPLFALPIPNVEGKSLYVPHVCRVANGDLWAVVKGDDSQSIHAYKSTDNGQTFAYQGVLIAPSGGSNWDAAQCKDPVIAYDAATDTVHYLWKGSPTLAGYGGFAIGHATAPGTDPMNLTRDSANPILTSAAVQAYFASSLGVTAVGDLYAGDVMRDPWNVITVWCGFRDQAGVYRIFRTRGDWNNFTPRNEGLISPTSPHTFVQAPCVFKTASGYTMLFTEGHDSGNPGALHQMSATCADDGNWSWVRTGNAFLPNGPADAWDGKLAYAAHLLKSGAKYDTPHTLGGAWQLYYSGAPMTGSTAEAGVARLTPMETAIL